MQVYRIPGVAAPRNIRTLQKASALTDPWLVGSPSGVLGVYDLSQADGYTGESPVDGTPIRDLLGRNKAAFRVVGGGSPIGVSYAGGGFDFSNVPAGTFYRNIELPPAVLAGLQDSDAWLFAAWVKLPSVADWNANASFFQIISAGDGVGSGLTLFAVSLTTASILLRGFNGTSFGNAYASSMVIPRDNFAGQIVQIGVYRRNGSLNLRLKSAATITAVSSSYPTGQTMSLAGKPIDLGWHKGTLSTMAIEPGSPRPLNGLRYYRAAAESLSVSGRDPVAVLDADWAGCNARFS